MLKEKPKPDMKAQQKQDISRFKGDSHAYSNKRPVRKVLSRYSR